MTGGREPDRGVAAGPARRWRRGRRPRGAWTGSASGSVASSTVGGPSLRSPTPGYSARQLHRRLLPVFGYGPQHLARVLRWAGAVVEADGGPLGGRRASSRLCRTRPISSATCVPWPGVTPTELRGSVSDPSKTGLTGFTSVGGMKLTPAVIEMVVPPRRHLASAPSGATSAPSRPASPHVDVDLGGIHLAFDTREMILSFDPAWTEPSGGRMRPRVLFASSAG